MRTLILDGYQRFPVAVVSSFSSPFTFAPFTRLWETLFTTSLSVSCFYLTMLFIFIFSAVLAIAQGLLVSWSFRQRTCMLTGCLVSMGQERLGRRIDLTDLIPSTVSASRLVRFGLKHEHVTFRSAQTHADRHLISSM